MYIYVFLCYILTVFGHLSRIWAHESQFFASPVLALRTNRPNDRPNMLRYDAVFNRVRISVQNFTPKMIFFYGKLHIILKPRNVKNLRAFAFFQLQKWDIENPFFVDINWRCLKTLIALLDRLLVNQYSQCFKSGLIFDPVRN